MLSEGAIRVTFADVAGADEAKAELQEIIEFLKEPGKFQKLGGKIPRGVLLLGPPGTASIRAWWPRTRSCSWSRSAASLTTLLVLRDLIVRHGEPPLGFTLRVDLALVHGAVRQLRRGDRRGARQCPGRHPAQDAQETMARQLIDDGARDAERARSRRRCCARATWSRRGGSAHPR